MPQPLVCPEGHPLTFVDPGEYLALCKMCDLAFFCQAGVVVWENCPNTLAAIKLAAEAQRRVQLLDSALIAAVHAVDTGQAIPAHVRRLLEVI